MQPSPGMPCPRCGRQSAPGDGPFCRHCGRYLAPLVWVAEPPAQPAEPLPQPTPRYAGPPRYRFPPRWGFPARPWRPPADRPARPDPVLAARSLAVTVVPLLWSTAVIALLAASAEVWRYVLLLASREGALGATTVAASDAFVASAATVAPVLTAISGGLLVLWTVRAAQAAAAVAGVRPARSTRAIVLGWLVPGLNLAVPGSVLAEIEHAALALPAGRRPRPSRLLLAWWAAWVAGGVLAAVVLLWSLRTGVQARADGVVLHAVLDALAAVTAGLTAVLTARLTRLLTPTRHARRQVVVAVRAPAAVPVSTEPTESCATART